MSAPRRAAVELTLACLAALGAVWSWLNASSQVVVAPVTDGQPSTMSVNYHPPLVLLALTLAAVAQGIQIHRIHDVAPVRQGLSLWQALEEGPET